ncbi:MAG: iron-sulfur cluster assembly scaffold protein [Nanoarchaeota archaeon]|nr:iron-sulfur cluster assembly scaffold protein [Nanoarchaeota archaeon]
MADIKKKETGQQWFYSDTVKEHFLHPHNMANEDKLIDEMRPNAMGEVGSPACGDVMKMWLHIDDGRIKKCLWRTFGCASAIASTSVLSEMVTEKGGMTLEEAEKIRPKDIIKRLGGLPPLKVHCSVLGDQALRAAIADYKKKAE